MLRLANLGQIAEAPGFSSKAAAWARCGWSLREIIS
jgi:hypothetical protein